MVKLWNVFGLLLAVIALICIGICIFQEGHNKLLLPIGLLCNSLALFIHCFITKKQRR
ncbi:MAG: hypothetical protein K2K54_02385 [Lachnospiraceae bacterium]|nr:hypothetical protein [Lachnospiraceae bacterium]